MCGLSGCGPEFNSLLTAATSSVLAAELDSCKELLELEPDNKCEHTYFVFIKDPTTSPPSPTTPTTPQGVF